PKRPRLLGSGRHSRQRLSPPPDHPLSSPRRKQGFQRLCQLYRGVFPCPARSAVVSLWSLTENRASVTIRKPSQVEGVALAPAIREKSPSAQRGVDGAQLLYGLCDSGKPGRLGQLCPGNRSARVSNRRRRSAAVLSVQEADRRGVAAAPAAVLLSAA